jgi:RHS repeat-associated protein
VPKATLTLSPTTSTLPVGTAANLSVIAKRPDGRVLPGMAVVFRVTAGPDVGKTFQILTDATGKAAYTFNGNLAGTDTVEAWILMSNGTYQSSNPVTVTWTAPKTLSLTPYSAIHTPGKPATVTAALSQPLSGVAVTFRVVSGPTVGRTGQAITDAVGRASFIYAGANPGVDTLQATAVVSGETLSSNLVAVEWTSIPTTLVYTGAQVGKYSDAMILAARLTESTTGQPLAGKLLAFVLGSQMATAITGADGTATVEIVSAGLPGATPLAVAFAGEGAWSGSATSRLAVITPEDTALTLSGVSAVAGGGAQPVSARLVDDDGQPLAGRTVTFRLGTAVAEAVTGADGTATASLSVPNLATGTARLEAAFSGDAWYRASSAASTVLVAQPTSFVIWGGNTPGLRLGERVQFWGAQWSRQVRGGDYADQADFKGWSNAPLPPRLCQPNAHTTGTPRLDASCWTSKPGNSNPPAKLGNYIQVIVSTSIAKNGSTIYGNIAATVVLQVDTSSAYGPDPGHPGYGTVLGVLEDGGGVFGSAAVTSLSAQAATATRRISLYSPEMSLMAETELTTAARPAILSEYIWFDGRPLAQVDGAGTVSWTFTDHLGTPLLQTSSLQGIVWRAEHEPYGSIYALRSYDRHQPLRFPGQEAEQLGTGANGVTERSYNVHRWYRAGWGRYTQADPLGRQSNPHPFSYAKNRPTFYTDTFGLVTDKKDCVCCTQESAFQEHEKIGVFLYNHWPSYAWTPARIWKGGSCLTAAIELRRDVEHYLAP